MMLTSTADKVNLVLYLLYASLSIQIILHWLDTRRYFIGNPANQLSFMVLTLFSMFLVGLNVAESLDLH